MARIVIGVCGEGRGHAARARVLMERMGSDHEYMVACSGDAMGFLSSLSGLGCRLLGVPCVRFQYRDGRMDLLRSFLSGVSYAALGLPGAVDMLLGEMESFRPDLAVTDFEPAVARAACRLGVPLVSLDHQHFLVSYDLGSLPASLRVRAAAMGLAVRAFIPRADRFVVSAFFRPGLKPGWGDAVGVGPMIRRSILNSEPAFGGHLLAYLRGSTPARVLDLLSGCGLPVRVYGLGFRESFGGLSFHEVEEGRFSEDLAGCRAVVAAAGNQLIGESLHLGKPFLALPESSHWEQMINAHFLRGMGCGEFSELEALDSATLEGFLGGLDRFESGLSLVKGRLDGASDAVRVLEGRIGSVRAPIIP